MIEKALGSWEEFRGEVKRLQDRQRSSDRPVAPLLFRGQCRSDWPLVTALERLPDCSNMSFIGYYRHISLMRSEVESLTNQHWQIPSYPEVQEIVRQYNTFSMKLIFGEAPAYAYMAYLRHHGFPSPLLDWSRSPYVAAFFAFRNAQSDTDRAAVFVLSEASAKLGSSDVAQIHRLGPYIRTHRRHFLQQSEYTMCLKYEQSEWRFAHHESVPPWHGTSRDDSYNFDLTKFTIPGSERLKILRELDEYNLNAFSLFGSEESLIDTLALKRFELAQVS